MNYTQLVSIAKRGGAILWLRSNKIEFLDYVGGNVFATRVLPCKRTHAIQRREEFQYYCRELYLNVEQLNWENFRKVG